MSKRVTIVLSDINHRKLRVIQSKLTEDGDTTSFSKVINMELSKSLKNIKLN